MADLKHGVLSWQKRGEQYISGEYTITCDNTLRYPFKLQSTYGMLLYGRRFEDMLDFADVHYKAQVKAVPEHG